MIAKLVRDRADAVKAGQCQAANSLPGKHMALLLKLHEEVEEISRDASRPYEYADMLEVLFELARINNVSWGSIEAEIICKRAAKGAFREAQIWTADVKW